MNKLNVATSVKTLLISVTIGLSSLPMQLNAMETADEGKSDVEPMALRLIMQDLELNMQRIASAIIREDLVAVADLAPLVADHEQPPMTEKMRILSFMGSDAGTFKSLDGVTHDTAMTLKELAENNDGDAVIKTYADLLQSCVACHQKFRKPFVAHFYR
ncbi:MAG TPA: cytochrome C [Kangiella sp.]|uniref:cytochrome C n=1 Tax=Kangiella sp. TaxID=1920245 RepID=UPI002F95EDB3